ncbi:MAG: protein translocase subunit SecD [Halanaerobiaceae bacterium]
MKFKQKKALKIALVVGLVIFAFILYQMYGINLGLDLQGGSHIVLQAEPTEDREINDEVMSGIQDIIERRVNQLGLSEPVIQREGEDRIIVELPAVDDPNEAIETIGRTAVLTFRSPDDEVLMRGDAVADASAAHDDYGRPVVQFELTDEGSQRFEEITSEYMGQSIGIYLDDEELTNPRVNQVIRGEGSITGYDNIEEAEEHAILIREGSLPVPVNVVERSTIGPSLGRIAIRKSIIAGLIGLLFVALYMIFYYKFPGALAALALAIYGVLLMGTLAGLKATLTLPGVAGLILSIGMAVDANIIIFERIKDERKNGKTLRAAIDAGFKRAYMTIFDANVTTIITAIILAYFTSGTVRGFAVTLGIGVVVSMFSAFVVTRIIIDLFSGSDLLQNDAAFGAQRR